MISRGLFLSLLKRKKKKGKGKEKEKKKTEKKRKKSTLGLPDARRKGHPLPSHREAGLCTHEAVASCYLTAAMLPSCISYRFQAPQVQTHQPSLL